MLDGFQAGLSWLTILGGAMPSEKHSRISIRKKWRA